MQESEKNVGSRISEATAKHYLVRGSNAEKENLSIHNSYWQACAKRKMPFIEIVKRQRDMCYIHLDMFTAVSNLTAEGRDKVGELFRHELSLLSEETRASDDAYFACGIEYCVISKVLQERAERIAETLSEIASKYSLRVSPLDLISQARMVPPGSEMKKKPESSRTPADIPKSPSEYWLTAIHFWSNVLAQQV